MREADIQPCPLDAPRPGTVMIRVSGVSKTFRLHTRGGVELAALDRVDLEARAGECLALVGPSGAGKSSLLKALYGNYRIGGGRIEVRSGEELVALDADDPRGVLELRRRTLGYVSQFLRVIPRIATIDLVAEAYIACCGETAREEAYHRARSLLTRLALPEALWRLPPATFSGGEQQRVNLARGLIVDYPILLLDEPTASLDPANRDAVAAIIRAATTRGAAVIGIFHDDVVRAQVADRTVTLMRPGGA